MIYFTGKYDKSEVRRKLIEDSILYFYNEVVELNYFSPNHAYGYLYDSLDFYSVLKLQTQHIGKCNAMILLSNWRESIVTVTEFEMAKRFKIPTFEFDYKNHKIKLLFENGKTEDISLIKAKNILINY